MRPEPENEIATAVTVEQVHAEFERLLRDRNHMGVRNLIGDTLLDPRNPFQKARRRPKKWVLALLGIWLMAFLIAYVFHAN